ncbi:MAG: hypothetical protein R3E65_10395 [Steroidobacteraceae bacterium]
MSSGSVRLLRSGAGRQWLLPCLWLAVAVLASAKAVAQDVSAAQRRGAAEYLAALADGSPQVIGYAIHPAELDKLRQTLLTQLREEAARGDGTVRARLFGQATALAEVERWTTLVFFTNLARRLDLPRGRIYDDLRGVAAIRDSGELTHVVVRGRQPRDRGATQVIETVSLLPYGKDWKSALPSELEAQIEDLIDGRVVGRAAAAPTAPSAGAPTSAAATGGTGPAAPRTANPPDILAMLGAAETALVDGRCDQYYREYLSPNFRRTLSRKMLDTLIASCRNSLGARESLIAALRIVRRAAPRLEYEGTRASYDVSGQGLAYDRFVLEKIDDRWYIAE